LKSKFQVGSIKAHKANYARAQKVFHSNDVPREALDARKEVEKSKRPNILDTEPRKWNASVITDQKIQADPKDLKKQLLQVRAGLFDQKEVKRPKGHSDESISDLNRYICSITGKGPIGKGTKAWFNSIDERGLSTHAIAEQWPDWNNSTSTHTKDDVKQAQHRCEEHMQRRARMLEKVPKLDLTKYMNPEKTAETIRNHVRERKIECADLREQFKRECKVEFPQASDERLEAMAQRLMDERILAHEKERRFPVEHECFRPNMAFTTDDQRYRVFHHPGAWVFNDTEGTNVWSCCLSFEERSRGCECRVINPDRWNTAGYERGQAGS
jgi:hypothetical protein